MSRVALHLFITLADRVMAVLAAYVNERNIISLQEVVETTS